MSNKDGLSDGYQNVEISKHRENKHRGRKTENQRRELRRKKPRGQNNENDCRKLCTEKAGAFKIHEWAFSGTKCNFSGLLRNIERHNVESSRRNFKALNHTPNRNVEIPNLTNLT